MKVEGSLTHNITFDREAMLRTVIVIAAAALLVRIGIAIITRITKT